MVRKSIIVTACIISIFGLFIFSNKGVGFWHIYHMATMPEDLFSPLFTDTFEFHTKGFSEEYDLNPKYRDIYEVSITSTDDTIPSHWGKEKQNKNEVKGKIKIELFANETKLSENIATNWRRATFQKDNLNFYKSVSLIDFPIPIRNFKTQPTTIKITVIEPYTVLEEYKENIKLEVKVAATD